MAAVMTLTAGCYSYGNSYYSQASRIPKTTAAKDTLEEFDVSSLQREDGAFQFGDLAWGSSVEDVQQKLGINISQTQPVGEDRSYADVNYSILLLDRISLGFMPVFDNDGLSVVSIYFENVYTAEELDAFYDEVVALFEETFGKADDVTNTEQTSGSTTFQCETTFWYHEIDPTHMTTLQVGKLDSGSGTSGVVLGVNQYNPEELESESALEDGTEDAETTGSETGSAEDSAADHEADSEADSSAAKEVSESSEEK